MKKRILAFLLCFALVMPILPVSATETDPTETTAASSEPTVTSAPTDPSEPAPSTEPSEPTTPPVTPASGEEEEEATDPTEKETEPSNPATEPSSEPTDPSEPETEPSSEPTDPSEPETEPSTEATDPSEPETEPSTEATEPSEPETEPTEEETEPDFDVNAVIARLQTCTTQSEKDAIFAELTEEQLDELYLVAPELFAYIPSSKPAVNVTNPGKFLDPVEFPQLMRMMLFSANAIAEEEDSSLVLNKKSEIKAGTTNTYTITLEAYTKGEVKVTSTATPCDVVFVIDESGSMDYHIGVDPVYSSELDTSKSYYVVTGDSATKVEYSSWRQAWRGDYTNYTPKTSASDTTSGHVQFYADYQTRESAIVTAVNAFLKELRESNAELPSDVTAHRVGMIGFSTIGNTRIIRNLHTTSTTDISTSTINTDGGTYVHAGLALVDDVFDGATEDTSGEIRNRVVILFTDGEPGSGDWDNSNSGNVTNGDFGVAAQAINTAKTLKADTDDNGYGVTLYTVGIFSGADPSDTTSNGNKYMNAVSSNYKTASATSARNTLTVTWGNRATGNYYLSASDSNSLTKIFEAIASQTATPGIQLDSTTQVIDTVTPYFTIPKDATGITVQVADYDGTTFGTPYAATGVTANVEAGTNKVIVTGFDFNKNFVATTGRNENDSTQTGTFYGRKLIISFDVMAKDEFWGGNNVPTNKAESSGLYVKNEEGQLEMIENGSFGKSPEVNVPVKVPAFNGVDKNIYLLGETPAANALTDFVLPSGDNAWQIDYVDVTGPTADKTISNTEDTTDITISVTASPKYDGTGASGAVATPDTETATANVYVWVPSLTYKDTVHDYMSDEPVYDTNNKVGEMTWVHGTDTYDAGKMFNQTAPAVTLSYVPVSGITEGKITSKDHVPVNVIAKINDTDVTAYVAFEHEACNFEGCPFDADGEIDGEIEFYLHVINVSADLKIVKTVSGTIDTNQPFVFIIQGAADNDLTKDIKLTVSIQGAGEVTIQDLPIGTYTVTEDTSWAWRFTPTYGNNPITLVADADNVVTISNTQKDDSWINDFSAVVKNTFGTAKN